MSDQAVPADVKQPQGIVPFVTAVAQYFMDFLETDFHKVKNPKRHIQTRNGNNLQISINLNRYKKYNALVWKVIRNGFEDEALKELKRGMHTTAIPQSLLQLINDQTSLVSQHEIDTIVKLFKNEIELALTKNQNNTPAAITMALDGIARVIREKFLASFVERIREPLEKLKTATVDSIYQIEEELLAVLMWPFEGAVSSIVNQLSLGNELDADNALNQIFELKDVKDKLKSFFDGFAASDLFFEVSELFNNKNLMET